MSNLSKLTKNQIEYIKNNCIPGHKDFGCAALAKKFNVDHSTISKIIHDCAWKNYSDGYKLIKNKVNKSIKSIKECEQNNDCKKTIKDTKKPPYDELLKLIKSTSFVQIGKMYEVSDNAVRKWCMSYNLPYRQKDIKKLIDIECE